MDKKEFLEAWNGFRISNQRKVDLCRFAFLRSGFSPDAARAVWNELSGDHPFEVVSSDNDVSRLLKAIGFEEGSPDDADQDRPQF